MCPAWCKPPSEEDATLGGCQRGSLQEAAQALTVPMLAAAGRFAAPTQQPAQMLQCISTSKCPGRRQCRHFAIRISSDPICALMLRGLLWLRGDRPGMKRTGRGPGTALLAMLLAVLREACAPPCPGVWGGLGAALQVTGPAILNCVAHAAKRLSTSATSTSTSSLMACLPSPVARVSAAVPSSALSSAALRLPTATQGRP